MPPTNEYVYTAGIKGQKHERVVEGHLCPRYTFIVEPLIQPHNVFRRLIDTILSHFTKHWWSFRILGSQSDPIIDESGSDFLILTFWKKMKLEKSSSKSELDQVWHSFFLLFYENGKKVRKIRWKMWFKTKEQNDWINEISVSRGWTPVICQGRPFRQHMRQFQASNKPTALAHYNVEIINEKSRHDKSWTTKNDFFYSVSETTARNLVKLGFWQQFF